MEDISRRLFGSFPHLPHSLTPLRMKDLRLLILLSVFLLFHAILYQIYGIKIITDSKTYLDNAESLVNHGTLIDRHYSWYLGYILLLVPTVVWDTGPEAILIFQVLVSALAVIAFYRTAAILTGNTSVAFYTALFFLGWYEIFTWNFVVRTESLFISLNVFLLYLIVKGFRKKWEAVVFAGLILWIFFLRPNGFVSAVAVLAAGAVYMYSSKRKLALRLFAVLIMVMIPAGISFLSRLLAGFEFVHQYAGGEIVYRAASVAGKYDVENLILAGSGLVLPQEAAPLAGLLKFIAFNPFYFIKLFFLKIFYFLAHVKPYYSFWHNAWIIATLVPAYLLAVLGLRSRKVAAPVKAFVITFITLNTIIIGFAVEDWDGRFLMPLLPAVFAMAGVSRGTTTSFL